MAGVSARREIDWELLSKRHLAACEDGLDSIWLWNQHDHWEDTDEVILRLDRLKATTGSGDLTLLTAGRSFVVAYACRLVGLTAGPKVNRTYQ